MAIRVEADWQGRRFGFVNTHLHHEPHHDEVIRYPQAESLLGWAGAQAHPCILVGDFNAFPASTTIQRVKRDYRSAYETVHGAEPEATCPTPLDPEYAAKEKMPIDYVFYPDTFAAVKSCDLIAATPAPHDPTLYPSDHYGLLAEFA